MSALCVEYVNENRMFPCRDSNNDKLPCCVGCVCVCVCKGRDPGAVCGSGLYL